jgi:hypothetical protein
MITRSKTKKYSQTSIPNYIDDDILENIKSNGGKEVIVNTKI